MRLKRKTGRAARDSRPHDRDDLSELSADSFPFDYRSDKYFSDNRSFFRSASRGRPRRRPLRRREKESAECPLRRKTAIRRARRTVKERADRTEFSGESVFSWIPAFRITS